MKLGIIKERESPVIRALEIILGAKENNLQVYDLHTFKPKDAEEQQIDILLLYGSVDQSGYAIGLRKHIPETIAFYYLYTEKPKLDVAAYGIKAYGVSEFGELLKAL